MSCDSSDGLHPFGPPPNVWPWGAEEKFPWKLITGIWVAGHDEAKQYYLFKTVGSNKSGRELKITQYDPSSCATIGAGTGFEDSSSNVVKALMSSSYGAYEMSVHAFSPDKVGATCVRSSVEDGSLVMVMRVYRVGGGWTDSSSVSDFQLRQINTSAYLVCE